MDFLILRPLFPEVGYHFLEGGEEGGAEGSKVCDQKGLSGVEDYVPQNKQRSNDNAADYTELYVGQLLFVAPPASSADRHSNHRPEGMRPAALPFDRYLF